MEKFDVVVIGSGPGGYPAAIRAAQLGASVALVERDTLGGTCLNWGCIPTKTLIAGADVLYRSVHSESLGIRRAGTAIDYAAMVRRKDDVVEKLRGGVEMLLKSNGITVYQGEAFFASRHRIGISGGIEPMIEAGSTIVATGSTSFMPDFLHPGPKIVDSKEFLALSRVPATMIVLGGGVIGCEFACMAAQLGVRVTIVELLEDILLVVDSDVRRVLRRHMEKRLGIKILTGKPLEDISMDRQGVRGTVDGTTVEAELMLAAVGRGPVTDGLCLENADVKMTDTGHIVVGPDCRTSAATIYAVGDVTDGSTQLAHAATSQGITAAENAVGKKRTPAESLVPACIFTSPEIGSVGLTEQQAKTDGIDVAVGKYLFAGLGKALASDEPEGFVKWLADPETGQLLGAQAVGPHATELISEAGLAIRAELTAEELGRTIHCHPTYSEAWMEAAHAVHGTCIHQPPRHR